MTSKPYTVRKLDTDDPHWYVVDLRTPGSAVLAEGAAVDSYLHRTSAVRCADFLNENEHDGGTCLARYVGEFWPGRLCIERLGHDKCHQDGYGRTW